MSIATTPIAAPCQCPMAGYCARFKRDIVGRRHQICQGVDAAGNQTINPATRADYIDKWLREAGEWTPDQKSRGLGDVVAKMTSAIGIKPCGGCKKRQSALNTLVPFRNPERQQDPKPTDAMTPLPAQISDSRNLIYHIYPTLKTDNWRWNITQLLRRIEMFDGVRSIGVVTDSDTVTLEEVQREFAGVRIDHWIHLPNDPKSREGATFVALMNTLPRDDSVTCYAHAKGVRHESGSVAVQWAELLYQSTFDYWPMVENALREYPIAGTFKRYGIFKVLRNHHWHYSGTFYWFRNRETFARAAWSYLQMSFFGCVEAWPANVYTATEAACLFGDNAGDMYHARECDKHIANMAARRELFAADKHSCTGSGVSDAAFMAGEISRGYTEWHWQALVNNHANGARFIKNQLKCRTVIEIGSGLGMFLVAAMQCGLDARGSDINSYERDFAIEKGIHPERYSLAKIDAVVIPGPVDCIYSVEVFEHCTDAELEPLARQIATNCKWFYFTSTPHLTTPEADAAWGHVNVKSRDEWIEFFGRHGLRFDRDDTSVTNWGMVFKGALCTK